MFFTIKKIVLFILIVSLFNSCSLFKINGAFKDKYLVALPNLKNYVGYTFIVNAKEPFTVKTIILGSEGREQVYINRYDFIDLDTKSGHAVISTEKLFKKGNYSFHFKLEDENRFNLNEHLTLSVNSRGKTYQLKDIDIKKQKTIASK